MTGYLDQVKNERCLEKLSRATWKIWFFLQFLNCFAILKIGVPAGPSISTALNRAQLNLTETNPDIASWFERFHGKCLICDFFCELFCFVFSIQQKGG